MILTLTPNPSVDRTVFLTDIVLGSVNRSQRSRSEPSGKGVNVALALRAHGMPVRAIVTAGGPVGAQLRQMLDTAGLDTVVVPIDGEIRSNISLTQPDGTVTKINEAGPVLSARGTRVPTHRCLGPPARRHRAGVRRKPARRPAHGLVRRSRRISPPPRNIRRRRHLRGTPCRLPVRDPDLVKPNVHELAELTGRVSRTLGDVIDAAQEVRNAVPVRSWPVWEVTALSSSTTRAPCGAMRQWTES